MNPGVTTVVVVLKTPTLLLGGSITFYALKAYRRTDSTALRVLAFGFGAVTLGALFAGIVDQLLPLESSFAPVVESLFTTRGVAIVLYSL